MTTPTTPQSANATHHRRLIAVVVLVPVLAALALWAFAWPATRTAPRDLPLGVAGPANATAPVERRLAGHEGAFAVHHYADEAAARAAVKGRAVYGAVVVGAGGPKLLTASAASPVVAQLLQQSVGTGAQVVDVVATPKSDPRGAALTASVLPLALAGIAAGAAVTLFGLRGVRAATALVGAAALVGVLAAGIADSWLGVLAGDWWTEAATFGLSSLAVSAAVAGLAALIGPAGVGVTAGVMMLFGNAFSGAASAPQMLPEPAGTIGQWLPPGAGTTLLRAVSFFDGAGATSALLTLVWWAALGLGAVLLGSALKARVHGEAPEANRESEREAVAVS